MTYTTITYAVEDAIATITLNRPEARNGFTADMANELGAAITAADLDDDVRVIVLTATGKYFCVGMDLSAGGGQEDMDSPDWVEWAAPGPRPPKPPRPKPQTPPKNPPHRSARAPKTNPQNASA
ncbi:enoyl-CoA hydratase-related protein, partial [Nocardia farcinica]|uniref:enoyl-CoA hydratase-related protein n=1 Tax=Nocardia farcinica TaxID=37329 RepID=UPI0024553AC0